MLRADLNSTGVEKLLDITRDHFNTTTPWHCGNFVVRVRSIPSSQLFVTSKFPFHLLLQFRFSLSFPFNQFLLHFHFAFDFDFDFLQHSDTVIAMDETYAPFDSAESNGVSRTADHGWQKVTYAKKHKKKEANGVAGSNKLTFNGNDAAFRSLELHSEDRRRRILEAQSAADADFDDAPVRSKQRSRLNDDDYDEDDEDVDRSAENGKVEEAKKVKKEKKPKKPKVTVAEAAAKIDAADLESFLVDISVWCLIH